MNDQAPGAPDGTTRLAQGGEAATTRFGMEDGDNTDISTTGMGSDDDVEQDSSTAAEEEAAKLGDFA